MKKPIQVKPLMYTWFFESLKEIARENGYNLLIHGSMNRDLDLVAVPWVDKPSHELKLIQEFDIYFRGECFRDPDEDRLRQLYHHSTLPGKRSSYVINLNRADKGGEWKNLKVDEQYYLDISITPLPC